VSRRDANKGKKNLPVFVQNFPVMGNAHSHQSIRIQHRWFVGAETEVRPGRRLTDAELMEFCAENPELRVEMDKTGKLIIMPPAELRRRNRRKQSA